MNSPFSEPTPAAPPTADRRFTVPIDVHAVLLRPDTTGWEVLLTRRAGNVYASGLWHMPSGHIDGGHENVVEALVREGAGITIARTDVQIATVIHHRNHFAIHFQQPDDPIAHTADDPNRLRLLPETDSARGPHAPWSSARFPA